MMVKGKRAMDEHIKWYRPPLDKEVLARLKQRSDLRGFMEVLSRLVFSGATGALAVYSWYNLPWQWTLLAVYVHGMFFTFLSEHAAVHELAHGTVFKTRFWNSLFFRLFAFMTWSSCVKFRVSHTQHHMVTCYTDRDLEVVIPYKLTALDWIGYAIEHHMYASVPFYNLPALSKEIRGYLPEPKSIWRTWSEDILPTLKRQKTDPNYVSKPALPECDS